MYLGAFALTAFRKASLLASDCVGVGGGGGGDAAGEKVLSTGVLNVRAKMHVDTRNDDRANALRDGKVSAMIGKDRQAGQRGFSETTYMMDGVIS